MEGFYGVLFALLSCVCMVLEWPRAAVAGKPVAAAKPAAFTAFRNNYLVVYSLMMGASRRRAAARDPPACADALPRFRAFSHTRSGRLAAGPLRVCALRRLRLQ